MTVMDVSLLGLAVVVSAKPLKSLITMLLTRRTREVSTLH